ncbi:hypothetical protein niasHT_011742 [Heterodera trifolii]|uniref:Uncharacterized protein n=1 Tax=Heterodera trifolii TaxID=157864 RepID=A0ABD2LGU6_9BILA
MVHIVFDPSIAQYDEYVQYGSGLEKDNFDYFRGSSPFQRGYGIQRGAGVGDVFRGLWRFFLPILRRVGTTVGSEALSTGQRVLERVGNEGVPFKEALVSEGKRGIDTVFELLPSNPLTDTPYHFKLHSSQNYIDLSKSYLLTEFRIRKENNNGQLVDLTVDDADIAPIQMIGQTFIRNIKMSINGREIFNANSLMAYKTYFSHELSYSTTAKDSHLNAAGYYRDMGDALEIGNGFIARRNLFAGSNVAQFIAKIDTDLFNQPLYLINFCELDIEILPNDNAFVLIAPSGGRYHFEVVGLKMYVKKVSLMDGLALDIARKLEVKPVRYAVRKTMMKSMFISQGRYEFTANMFMDQIKHEPVHSSVKASVAERAIRNVKQRLYRYFAEKETLNWVDAVQKIVDGINSSPSRVHGMRPIDVDFSNAQKVWKRMYRPLSFSKKTPRFRKDEFVRMSREKGQFEKGYLPNYGDEILEIDEVLKAVRPIRYKLRDEHGEKFKGSFYDQELARVRKDAETSYRIEKVYRKRKRTDGTTEMLVKFVGYPTREWIHESQLV